MIETVIRSILVTSLLVGTCITNGIISLLILRFDSLRSNPNILLLSSCVVDILACFCNLPGFVAGFVLEDRAYFVGREISMVISSLHVFYTFLNLSSLTVMMIDRFCALKFNAYKLWHTAFKLKVTLAVKWLGCLVVTLVLLLPIWDIDLGDEPSFIYRRAHFKARGKI